MRVYICLTRLNINSVHRLACMCAAWKDFGFIQIIEIKLSTELTKKQSKKKLGEFPYPPCADVVIICVFLTCIKQRD